MSVSEMNVGPSIVSNRDFNNNKLFDTRIGQTLMSDDFTCQWGVPGSQ